MAKEPNNAIEIALLFWQEKGCGLLARQGDIKGVTKLINLADTTDLMIGRKDLKRILKILKELKRN
ncbi:hypothetical protein OFR75_00330 [Brachyspira hyodysenteriae]|nr:hypothetical protein [Brachyspira hyodysenteriae]